MLLQSLAGDHKPRSGSEESDSAAVMDIVQEPLGSDVSGDSDEQILRTVI